MGAAIKCDSIEVIGDKQHIDSIHGIKHQHAQIGRENVVDSSRY